MPQTPASRRSRARRGRSGAPRPARATKTATLHTRTSAFPTPAPSTRACSTRTHTTPSQHVTHAFALDPPNFGARHRGRQERRPAPEPPQGAASRVLMFGLRHNSSLRAPSPTRWLHHTLAGRRDELLRTPPRRPSDQMLPSRRPSDQMLPFRRQSDQMLRAPSAPLIASGRRTRRCALVVT